MAERLMKKTQGDKDEGYIKHCIIQLMHSI